MISSLNWKTQPFYKVIIIHTFLFELQLKIGFLTKKEFLQRLEKESQFKPLGEKIYEYELLEAPNHTYEVFYFLVFSPSMS